ncbi:MAG TPA: type II toxin-antitoxin system PemK/MazF family toxin [Solimonas sp.]|nr:type II toxin-antitoxin system PemK/MazF family toxin [Solimonas sp.]
MIFDAYDVVVVPFPFTDRSSEKRRPALVLSSLKAFNRPARHAVMAMITSAAEGKSHWPLDVALADLKAAGLSHSSLVRMKLFTLDLRLVIRKAGRLSPADQAAVGRAVKALWT